MNKPDAQYGGTDITNIKKYMKKQMEKSWQQNLTLTTHMDKSNWTTIQKTSVYSPLQEKISLDTTVF